MWNTSTFERQAEQVNMYFWKDFQILPPKAKSLKQNKLFHSSLAIDTNHNLLINSFWCRSDQEKWNICRFQSSFERKIHTNFRIFVFWAQVLHSAASISPHQVLHLACTVSQNPICEARITCNNVSKHLQSLPDIILCLLTAYLSAYVPKIPLREGHLVNRSEEATDYAVHLPKVHIVFPKLLYQVFSVYVDVFVRRPVHLFTHR